MPDPNRDEPVRPPPSATGPLMGVHSTNPINSAGARWLQRHMACSTDPHVLPIRIEGALQATARAHHDWAGRPTDLAVPGKPSHALLMLMAARRLARVLVAVPGSTGI